MTFLAILSPSKAKGPFLIDCYDDEPWRRRHAIGGGEGSGRGVVSGSQGGEGGGGGWSRK